MTSAGSASMVASKFVPLGLRHAGGRLVEQQHARPAGEGQRDFEQAAACRRAGSAVRWCITSVKAKALDDFDDLVGHRGFGADGPPPIGAGAEPLGDHEPDRFQRREVEEQLIDLEGARHAEPHALVRHRIGDVVAFEHDAAGGRAQHAGQEIDHRGLAGAVRPDQRVPRAFLHREIDVLRGKDAAEALFQSDGLQDRHRSQRPSGAAPPCAAEPGHSRRAQPFQQAARQPRSSRPCARGRPAR